MPTTESYRRSSFSSSLVLLVVAILLWTSTTNAKRTNPTMKRFVVRQEFGTYDCSGEPVHDGTKITEEGKCEWNFLQGISTKGVAIGCQAHPHCIDLHQYDGKGCSRHDESQHLLMPCSSCLTGEYGDNTQYTCNYKTHKVTATTADDESCILLGKEQWSLTEDGVCHNKEVEIYPEKTKAWNSFLINPKSDADDTSCFTMTALSMYVEYEGWYDRCYPMDSFIEGILPSDCVRGINGNSYRLNCFDYAPPPPEPPRSPLE